MNHHTEALDGCGHRLKLFVNFLKRNIIYIHRFNIGNSRTLIHHGCVFLPQRPLLFLDITLNDDYSKIYGHTIVPNPLSKTVYCCPTLLHEYLHDGSKPTIKISRRFRPLKLTIMYEDILKDAQEIKKRLSFLGHKDVDETVICELLEGFGPAYDLDCITDIIAGSSNNDSAFQGNVEEAGPSSEKREKVDESNKKIIESNIYTRDSNTNETYVEVTDYSTDSDEEDSSYYTMGSWDDSLVVDVVSPSLPPLLVPELCSSSLVNRNSQPSCVTLDVEILEENNNDPNNNVDSIEIVQNDNPVDVQSSSQNYELQYVGNTKDPKPGCSKDFQNVDPVHSTIQDDSILVYKAFLKSRHANNYADLTSWDSLADKRSALQHTSKRKPPDDICTIQFKKTPPKIRSPLMERKNSTDILLKPIAKETFSEEQPHTSQHVQEISYHCKTNEIDSEKGVTKILIPAPSEAQKSKIFQPAKLVNDIDSEKEVTKILVPAPSEAQKSRIFQPAKLGNNIDSKKGVTRIRIPALSEAQKSRIFQPAKLGKLFSRAFSRPFPSSEPLQHKRSRISASPILAPPKFKYVPKYERRHTHVKDLLHFNDYKRQPKGHTVEHSLSDIKKISDVVCVYHITHSDDVKNNPVNKPYNIDHDMAQSEAEKLSSMKVYPLTSQISSTSSDTDCIILPSTSKHKAQTDSEVADIVIDVDMQDTHIQSDDSDPKIVKCDMKNIKNLDVQMDSCNLTNQIIDTSILPHTTVTDNNEQTVDCSLPSTSTINHSSLGIVSTTVTGVGDIAHLTYQKLISIFPYVDTNYIKSICQLHVQKKGVVNEMERLQDLIDELLENGDKHVSTEKIKSLDDNANYDLNEQYANLLGIFPNADPTFLRATAENIYNDLDAMKEFVQTNLEKPDYPTREQYLAKRKITEQQKQYTTEFKVEKFLEIFSDPFAYFENPARQGNFNTVAFEFLKQYFSKFKVRTLMKAYTQQNHNLSLTVKVVERLKADMKSKRFRPVLPAEDIPLLQEIAFIQHKAEISEYLTEQKAREENEFKELKARGELLECQCCYDNECLPSKCSTCDMGHIFCHACIIRGTESKLGDGETHIRCFVNCDSEFSLAVLCKILSPTKFSILLQKRQTAEVRAAGLEGLVSCPFCDFASIPPPEDKVFKCFNPECMKESCRLCKELNHVPLKCNELKSDKARLYLEEKMTEALVRTCHSCGRPFIKEEGCNKMHCVCGALQCYICDKPVTGYNHFNGQGASRVDLCPLWSDNHRMNAETVLKVAKTTMEQIKEQNPNIELHIDNLLPTLPQKTKGPHQDIANADVVPERVYRIPGHALNGSASTKRLF
ncbi:hypothetical protein KM043_017490 [Ampulex compressa]|nr:hypothetical protein KM043_017490 [Ampulex compressa]